MLVPVLELGEQLVIATAVRHSAFDPLHCAHNVSFLSGIIRFWPSIAHEGSFSELNADLGGEECFSLTDIQPVGSVLATTTANVGLIFTREQTTSVSYRVLKLPQGLLGGIGRKMSSLLWGTMASNVEMVR